MACNNLNLMLLVFFISVGEGHAQTLTCTSGSATICTGQFPDGSAAANLGLPGLTSPVASPYNAFCDGSHSDTSAFNSAISGNSSIMLPPNKTCNVNGLILGGGKVLNCNGSVLQADTTSNPGTWVVKKIGNYARVDNCVIADVTSFNRVSGTLSASPAQGSFSVSITNASSFSNGMPLDILLNSGAYFATKILRSNGVVASTLNLADPIPASVSAASVVNGGSGCAVGGSLIANGGEGAPATFRITDLAQ